jgi:hypothetical protein
MGWSRNEGEKAVCVAAFFGQAFDVSFSLHARLYLRETVYVRRCDATRYEETAMYPD